MCASSSQFFVAGAEGASEWGYFDGVERVGGLGGGMAGQIEN